MPSCSTSDFPADSLSTRSMRCVRWPGDRIPIVVLTTEDDDALAVQAVQRGAQDYLVKSRADASS